MERKNKKVRLYSLSTCPTCKKVKQFLEDNSITYEMTEVDLLDSGEQWVTSKEIKRYNPEASFPTLVIEEVIVGFDEKAIQDSLGIKGG
jgi:glutaredoxin